MRPVFRFFLTAVAFLVVGCALPTKQTDRFFDSPHALPETARVEGVPFIRQETGQCGPAALAMAMNWAGKSVTAEDLVPQVYTPKMKGSLQSDLITAGRRHGLLTVPITGLEALLTEVAAGNPVIVFENLGLSWVPQWHYAVVYGYDLSRREVILHSGPEQEKRQSIKRFEKDWLYSEHWGLVVLPPDRLSASASEFDQAAAAAGLEQAGQKEAAKTAYAKVLERWPKSLVGLFGAANLAVGDKNIAQGERFLERATRAHPQTAIAWHNLAIVQGMNRKFASARHSALKAIELASPKAKTGYAENLKPWISKAN